MNIYKKIRDLQVGDACYVLHEDLTVEVIKVVEVLESMYTPDCMKVKFDRYIPDIHVEGSVNMVSLGPHLGSLYLEKDLILNELEYRQNVIVQQIDKLKGDCSIDPAQKFNSEMQTNVL